MLVDLTDAGWASRDKVVEVRSGVLALLPLSGDEIAAMRAGLQAFNAGMLAIMPAQR